MMEIVRSLTFIFLFSMALFGLCSSNQSVNASTTQANNATALIVNLPNDNTTSDYTKVTLGDKKRQNGGGCGGGSGGGGGGGGGFAWGWEGGGGGGGGGGSGKGGGGGWGWGGGGAGSWKWGRCSEGGRGGRMRHEKQRFGRGNFKLGEFAQCMGGGRCKGMKLDCPLHCGGFCFYDCINMCKAHCRR